MRIPLEEKPEIHKKVVGLSPYKTKLVELFYGNNASEVITYHWVYKRPEEEKLKQWHEQLTAAQAITTQSMKG